MCLRRRSLVLSSPQRLKLQLSCTPETPARVTLEVWPVLPLLVQGHIPETSDADDIVAVLEHRHRVCKIDLNVPSSQFGKVSTAMREPFPKLTDLSLWSYDETAPALSDLFLGGSAPQVCDSSGWTASRAHFRDHRSYNSPPLSSVFVFLQFLIAVIYIPK